MADCVDLTLSDEECSPSRPPHGVQRIRGASRENAPPEPAHKKWRPLQQDGQLTSPVAAGPAANQASGVGTWRGASAATAAKTQEVDTQFIDLLDSPVPPNEGAPPSCPVNPTSSGQAECVGACNGLLNLVGHMSSDRTAMQATVAPTAPDLSPSLTVEDHPGHLVRPLADGSTEQGAGSLGRTQPSASMAGICGVNKRSDNDRACARDIKDWHNRGDVLGNATKRVMGSLMHDTTGDLTGDLTCSLAGDFMGNDRDHADWDSKAGALNLGSGGDGIHCGSDRGYMDGPVGHLSQASTSQIKREPAAALKAQKAVVKEEEKKRKAAEKEQQRLEKEQQKQHQKEARQQKVQQQQQEKAQKRAAKDMERQIKGKHCHSQIVVLIDCQAAKEQVFWQMMSKLKEEAQNQPAFKYNVEDLPLSPYHCICFRRELPRTFMQLDASQAGSQRDDVQPSQAKGLSQRAGPDLQSDTVGIPVPFVLVVFDDAQKFIDEMLVDSLRSLVQRAASCHPEATLGILTVALEGALASRERKGSGQQAGRHGTFNRQHIEDACVQLALSCPAVRIRHAQTEHDAADYVRDLTRALAEQPYKPRVSLLESFHGTQTNATREMRQKADESSLPPASAQLAASLHAAKGLNLGHQQCLSVAGQYRSLSRLIEMMMDSSRPLAETLKEIADEKMPANGRRLGDAAAKKLHMFLMSDDPDAYVDM